MSFTHRFEKGHLWSELQDMTEDRRVGYELVTGFFSLRVK